MGHKGRIVTLGLAPAWDMICRGSDLAWGDHPVLEQQTLHPAGKAVNVSSALAWLGQDNLAAGLWGQEDYTQMAQHLQRVAPRIRLHMTCVPGRTRTNVTVLDQARAQELHLRCANTLWSRASLQALRRTLAQLIHAHDICVVAGALPSIDLRPEVLALGRTCINREQARLVLDAHGPMFQTLIEAGLPWLITPNVAELNELLARHISNTPVCLARAASELLDKVDMVLVSRGKLGAVLVTRSGAWQARCRNSHKVISTVGCGDFLLAGFVQALHQGARIHTALSQGIKVASARAWGWHNHRSWSSARREIKVDVQRI